MKNKTYVLNSILACVLGVYYLALILIRTFAPWIIVPKLDVPNLMLLSLAALLLEYYLAPGAKTCYVCVAVFSAVTFGLYSFAALQGVGEAVRVAVLGGIVFTAATWLFTSAADRLSSGPAAKAAPIVSAVGLYLASQCLMGMF